MIEFVAHLLIFESILSPKLIHSSSYHNKPLYKFSMESIYSFLSDVAYKQTS